MKHIELTAERLKTIDWYGNDIIDWASFKLYLLNGAVKELNNSYFAYKFDTSISSKDGKYAFIYQKLGTKGLLLKNGEVLREINRSYYFAEAYEYPAAFVTHRDKTYLIHCPKAYNQLDFEEVETGQIVADIKGREPEDIFHSRLEVNLQQSVLISRGWVWHPLDVLLIYNISECIDNPKLLDADIDLFNYLGTEICTASFIDANSILVGSSSEVINDDIKDLPANSIAVLKLETMTVSKAVTPAIAFGNLFAIDESTAWDLYKYPKIINIHTGEVLEEAKHIDSGDQRSSILNGSGNHPQIIFNRQTKSIAIAGKNKIDVLLID